LSRARHLVDQRGHAPEVGVHGHRRDADLRRELAGLQGFGAAVVEQPDGRLDEPLLDVVRTRFGAHACQYPITLL
jgi:hypothetical protein